MELNWEGSTLTVFDPKMKQKSAHQPVSSLKIQDCDQCYGSIYTVAT
jgi:hypothetical protein